MLIAPGAVLSHQHPQPRMKLTAEEAASVLTQFDIGIISAIQVFSRGSSRSPKAVVTTDRGKYLLKRRATHRQSDRRVALSHDVQNTLESAGFPLPTRIHVRDRDAYVLRVNDHVYELFEYVEGAPYSAWVGEVREAGAALARFHEIVHDIAATEVTPQGDYHDAVGVRTGLHAIPSQISGHDSVMGKEAVLLGVTVSLANAYDESADAVEKCGFEGCPAQIVHGDWHPGNMLFANHRVTAVIDYDSVRLARRVIDIANGVLQFSMVAEGEPATWPDHFDLERMAAFSAGYRSVQLPTTAEQDCIPFLMIEALIAEAVGPIATTGYFGSWPGLGFLSMAQRKVGWLRANTASVVKAVAGDVG